MFIEQISAKRGINLGRAWVREPTRWEAEVGKVVDRYGVRE